MQNWNYQRQPILQNAYEVTPQKLEYIIGKVIDLNGRPDAVLFMDSYFRDPIQDIGRNQLVTNLEALHNHFFLMSPAWKMRYYNEGVSLLNTYQDRYENMYTPVEMNVNQQPRRIRTTVLEGSDKENIPPTLETE